ncbi:NERD domain-containing protein/DEAD/DEAH box helicase [Thiobacter aerophilum]|uniref:DNA 3'-5' helicase II n=1 Tax=Thiobacter aerophilum TaxID=3121275 RepID=A0ABV0EFE6_9BURK
MATLIPTLGSARFDSRGELRLAERLRDCLEENALVWHNLPVGPFGQHPDFVILHPARGLVVLEVKDWRLDSLLEVNRFEVTLLTPSGRVKHVNPIEQVRQYMYRVVDVLKQDPSLLVPEGPDQGQLYLPFGFGVVFTNITRKQFEATDLGQVMAPERVVCRDEMAENVDPDAFRERLGALVLRRPGRMLSMPQMDRIRAILFPEIRVQQIALPLGRTEDAGRNDHLLAVMDLQQEQLARSLGEGHRIIRGVAGSGKTLILVFRAEHLAKVATRPILVLCYGNGIAGRIENAMQDRGVEDKVIVSTFHAWCLRMLQTYDLPLPSEQDYPDYEARLQAGVRRVIEAVDKGLIPSGQYEAVLIDEAHDFEPEWLALAARMVHPDTRSLLVVYDDAQAIYKGRKRPVWRQLGIDASGRTTVLKVNYRNTAQILRFACRFAADALQTPGFEEGAETIVLPETGGREGPEPVVRACVDFDGEAYGVAAWLKERRQQGYRWNEMAVVYPQHAIGQRIARICNKENIPVDLVKENRNRIDMDRDAVRFLSMHNSKGLEFPCVAVAGLGALAGDDLADDVRLAYVAMTRATHALFVSYSRTTPLVARLVG